MQTVKIRQIWSPCYSLTRDSSLFFSKDDVRHLRLAVGQLEAGQESVGGGAAAVGHDYEDGEAGRPRIRGPHTPSRRPQCLLAEVELNSASKQGDQIGRIFAYLEIVYYGKLF
jgi:hypothetical protein